MMSSRPLRTPPFNKSWIQHCICQLQASQITPPPFPKKQNKTKNQNNKKKKKNNKINPLQSKV